jgi:hypothetical protein
MIVVRTAFLRLNQYGRRYLQERSALPFAPPLHQQPSAQWFCDEDVLHASLHVAQQCRNERPVASVVEVQRSRGAACDPVQAEVHETTKVGALPSVIAHVECEVGVSAVAM